MKTSVLYHPKSRQFLFQALAISLLLHITFLTFLYYHPFLLQGPLKSLFGLSKAAPSLLEQEEDALEEEELGKNHLLEEAFQKIIVFSPHYQRPYDLIGIPKGIALAPNAERTSPSPFAREEKFDPEMPEFTLEEPSFTTDFEQEHLATPFFSAPEHELPIVSQLQIDTLSAVVEIPTIAIPILGKGAYEDLITVSDIVLTNAEEPENTVDLTPQFLSLKNEEALTIQADFRPLTGQIATHNFQVDKEQIRSTLFIPKSTPRSVEQKLVEAEISDSTLDRYNFPDMSYAAEWNDDFDVDVVFLPHPDGKGYIFSLSLKPNYDVSSHSIKQNIYFVLDRSNSIEKHRFSVFKRAVIKALSSLQHGDTFNILLMDKKLTYFSELNRPVNAKNIQAAEDFLEKQEAGGLFAGADIYLNLEKLLPSIPDDEEIHSVIVLTDGKTSLNAEKKQKAFQKWVQNNNGRVALYTAAVGRDNDLFTLDLLSSISGGKLLYSDTHASFPRKLSKLVLDLKDPLAKDLMITAIPENPNSRIEFYPAGNHLPPLYSHQPYTLVGQIDTPCAFDLVIQGRHREEWIAIKKNVSFIEGKKGDHKLEMQWNAQHANVCYSKFLKEGKGTYLKDAKDILKKSRTEIAFQ